MKATDVHMDIYRAFDLVGMKPDRDLDELIGNLSGRDLSTLDAELLAAAIQIKTNRERTNAHIREALKHLTNIPVLRENLAKVIELKIQNRLAIQKGEHAGRY